LEILLTSLLGPVQDVWAVGKVGRVITVEYNPRPLRVDPATTIACPILGLPGERYEQALRLLLYDPHSMDPKTREARVMDVIHEILRSAPGRLIVPELAFAVLGTLRRLAGPDGTRWVSMLRQWIEEAGAVEAEVIDGEVVMSEGPPPPPPFPVREKARLAADRTGGARPL